MANFIKGLLNKMSVTDEEDDYEDLSNFDDEVSTKKKKRVADNDSFEDDQEPEPAPVRTSAASSRTAPVMRKDTVKPYTTRTVRPVRVDSDMPEFEDTDTKKTARTERPVYRSTSSRSSSSGPLEVSIIRPTRFDDSQDICDMLVSEKATVVNLEGIDLALAQRIMDFISGAVYSLNGKIHQISNLIFFISPENVDISGDYLSYVEQNSFSVPTLNQ